MPPLFAVEFFFPVPPCFFGCFTMVRIWKYDIHHAAYDLFAILVQTPPPAAPEPPKGCCAPFCELIFGKSEIDYEKIGPVGITAVAPVSSRYLDPFDKNEKMRNGPIASGNFGKFEEKPFLFFQIVGKFL